MSKKSGMDSIKGHMSPGTFYWGGKGWCRWGWFEDVVLNTFYGFIGEGEGFRTQIRSFSKTKDGQLIPNKCRFNPGFLWTIDKRVILPGRFFPLPDDKYLTEEIGVAAETQKKYKQLREFQDALNDRFPAFRSPVLELNKKTEKYDVEVGIIRNFVFSADFLIKHFGSGISNLESGLNSFWRSVSSIYGGFWNFEVKQSQSHTGRIMIIDNDIVSTPVGTATVFPKLERKSTYNLYKDVGTDPDKEDPQKTFEFSVYGKDSIMSEFSVDVTLDSKMVTQAMYHTNKDISTVGHSGMNSPESMGIQALSTLNNVSKTQTEIDEYGRLQDIKDSIEYEISTPYLKGMMSYNDVRFSEDNDDKGGWKDGPLKLHDIETVDLVTKQLVNAADNANQLIREKKWREGMTWVDMTENKKYLVYDIHGRMHKPLVRGMLFYLNKSTESKRTVTPIVPLSVSFSLQGIAGMTIGDMFAIDYLPDVYREYAIFQVSSVGHEIGTEGWKTSVEAIMRIDMKNLMDDPKYSRAAEELTEEEKAKRRPTWLETDEQRLFIDAIDAELALNAEHTLYKEMNWFEKWWSGTNFEKILAEGVTQEQAGQELVQLKIIEDELVRIHKRMRCVTIGQLRRVLKLSGNSELEDYTDAGVKASMDAAGLGENGVGPIPGNKVRKIVASKLLIYINKRKGEAEEIRNRIFKDKLGKNQESEGYVYKRPQTVRYRQGQYSTVNDTPEMRHLTRQFYTLFMEIEKGLEGFKDSGGGESGKQKDAMDSGKYLAKTYQSIKFTWKHKDYEHMSRWTR